MSYLKQFEDELTKKLLSDNAAESIVTWVSERILESYRNGITAGEKGAVVKRSGKSRPMGSHPPEAPRRESRYS